MVSTDETYGSDLSVGEMRGDVVSTKDFHTWLLHFAFPNSEHENLSQAEEKWGHEASSTMQCEAQQLKLNLDQRFDVLSLIRLEKKIRNK